MAYAINKLYPNVKVSYKFKNRGPHRFNNAFMERLEYFIQGELPHITLTDVEAEWLHNKNPFFDQSFIDYLKNYQFNPEEVSFNLDSDNNLILDVNNSYWNRSIFWEIPLMAGISEIYFQTVDTNWESDLEDFKKITYIKGIELSKNDCNWIDFSTRRRRNFEAQNIVVETFKDLPGFKGTSNPYLARKHGINAVGTQAHEWIMGISALESLNHPNKFAMDKWISVYGGKLGTVLTDTYGTDAFLEDFNSYYARVFDSVRQDSGNPFKFTDKIINHYKSLGIDPKTKTIIFSDSLNTQLCVDLKRYCTGINCSFGIGTNFSGDFGKESPALNMVIKLNTVEGIPVIKLSDDKGKECGDPDYLKIAKKIFYGEIL